MTLPALHHIKIEESHEPIVDLSAYDFILEPMYFQQGYSKDRRMFLRRGVAEKLQQIQETTLAGYKFKIWDAWRPRAVQLALFQDYYQRLQLEHPFWDEARLQLETAVFVAPPNTLGVIPPHTTGGAVDLTLADGQGRELDMGTVFDHFGPEAYPDFFEGEGINDAARDARRLLRGAMQEAGFRLNPSEWWDFNYGNQVWGFAYNQPVVGYGEITEAPRI